MYNSTIAHGGRQTKVTQPKRYSMVHPGVFLFFPFFRLTGSPFASGSSSPVFCRASAESVMEAATGTTRTDAGTGRGSVRLLPETPSRPSRSPRTLPRCPRESAASGSIIYHTARIKKNDYKTQSSPSNGSNLKEKKKALSGGYFGWSSRWFPGRGSLRRVGEANNTTRHSTPSCSKALRAIWNDLYGLMQAQPETMIQPLLRQSAAIATATTIDVA